MRVMLLWFLLALTNAASAQAPYAMEGVELLQPDSILRDRLEPSALGKYIGAIDAAAAEVMAGRKGQPGGGYVVLAIKPGNQSKAWLDTRLALPPDLQQVLVARLQAVPAPSVQSGPVVFAIRASLWGGPAAQDHTPEIPAWRKAANDAGRPLEIGDLVERVWTR